TGGADRGTGGDDPRERPPHRRAQGRPRVPQAGAGEVAAEDGAPSRSPEENPRGPRGHGCGLGQGRLRKSSVIVGHRRTASTPHNEGRERLAGPSTTPCAPRTSLPCPRATWEF